MTSWDWIEAPSLWKRKGTSRFETSPEAWTIALPFWSSILMLAGPEQVEIGVPCDERSECRRLLVLVVGPCRNFFFLKVSPFSPSVSKQSYRPKRRPPPRPHRRCTRACTSPKFLRSRILRKWGETATKGSETRRLFALVGLFRVARRAESEARRDEAAEMVFIIDVVLIWQVSFSRRSSRS